MGNKYSGEYVNQIDDFDDSDHVPSTPVKKRHCTDIICCIIFGCYMLGMVAVAMVAIVQGSPRRLLFPTDSNGKICGTDVVGKPYLHFFDITKCITKDAVGNPLSFVKKAFSCPTPQVCVSKCNTLNATGYDVKPRDVICVEGTIIHNGVTNAMKKKLIATGKCAPFYLATMPVFYRCVPTVVASTIEDLGLLYPDGKKVNGSEVRVAEKAIEFLLSVHEVFLRIGDELKLTWKWLVVGFIVSMLVSIVYIVLARWITFPLVVLSALGTLGGLGYACYYSFTKYRHLDMTGTSIDLVWRFTMTAADFRQNKHAWLTLGVLLSVVLFILFFICVFLYSNARLACGLIAEASKAVCSMTSSLLFPIIPWVIQAAWFGWFIIVLLYLLSNGSKDYRVTHNDTYLDGLAINRPSNDTVGVAIGNFTFQNGNLTVGDRCDPITFNLTHPESIATCTFTKYVQNVYLFRMQMFHLIGWLWGANYVIAFTECSLAGAFASYYWAFHKPKDIPNFPVFVAMFRSVFYHTGSLALGAAIIGIIQLIRVTLEYIREKLRQHTNNKVADFLMKCLGCCFWCLEKCLRYINKNAYIMIAITGKNFCTSAKKAIKILVNSIGSTIAINGITTFILLLGKLFVTGIVGVASFYWFTKYEDANLTRKLDYSIVPIVISTLGAYLVSRLFFSVYDMGIDTIFLCYLHDVKINNGTLEKPYYMSKSLQDIMEKYNRKSVTKPEELRLPTN